jgi:hypothetical protein
MTLRVFVSAKAEEDLIQRTPVSRQWSEELLSGLSQLPGVTLAKAPSDSASEGVKSGPPESAFIVEMAGTASIAALVKTVASWLLRDRTRTIKFQIGDKVIEATGLTQEEQQRLIDWFQIQAGLRIDR